jgi:hypothetical protein
MYPEVIPPASRSTEFMKLAAHGHRDRIVQPTVAFDTAIWTTEVLQGRTEHQIPTPAEYQHK